MNEKTMIDNNITGEPVPAVPITGKSAPDDIYHAGQEEEESAGSYVLYLTFLLGSDVYGIEVSSVREVMECEKIFTTPCVPDYIRGVINLMGEVVPVIDLNSRFFNTVSNLTKSTGIVVVELKEDEESVLIGVMIDEIDAVTEIHQGKIESSPEIGSRIRRDFVSGIGKHDNRFIILLDINRVLDIGELSDFSGNEK